MVLGAALGDVVQEQRHVERPPVLDRAHDAVRERVLVLDPLAVDLGEHADRAQEMLVDRVVVVHVELHHRDDAAEIGDEAPEHPGLVHQPQHHLRRVARGQDVHEQAVRLAVVAQRRADEPERARREPARIRVDREVVPVGEPEQADQVHRIALERALAREVDAVVVDDEVVGFEPAAAAAPEAPDHAVEHRPVLRLARLELGADDRGEVADLLRDAEIRLHEALDAGQRAAPGLAHALGELALQLEAEALLGPAGGEMHVAADPPQEFLAALEQPELFRGEEAGLDELLRLAHPVDVFRDPEQRVEIAKPALAVLDVRLDEVARGAGLGDAGVALLELRVDELGRAAAHHLLVEAGEKRVVERRVAEEEPRLEERGADRHVRLRLADADVDRAGGVADLELQVPQHIEHRLDDAFAPGGLLVGQEEQEIDVGPRCERPAPVAAGRDNGELLGRGGVVGRVEVPHDAVVQGADDAVHEAGEPARAGDPVALAQERRLGFGAALVEDAAQLGNEPSAQARRIAQAFAVEPFGKAREPQRRLIQGLAHPVGLAHPGRPISLVIVADVARHRRVLPRHRRGFGASSSGSLPVIAGPAATATAAPQSYPTTVRYNKRV